MGAVAALEMDDSTRKRTAVMLMFLWKMPCAIYHTWRAQGAVRRTNGKAGGDAWFEAAMHWHGRARVQRVDSVRASMEARMAVASCCNTLRHKSRGNARVPKTSPLQLEMDPCMWVTFDRYKHFAKGKHFSKGKVEL